MVFLEEFPKGQIQKESSHQENVLSIPLSSGEWLILDKEELSDWELFLLDIQEEIVSYRYDSSLFKYFYEGKGQSPIAKQTIQFIHLRVWEDFHNPSMQKEWLEVIRTLFTNQVGYFQMSEHDLIFILRQDPFIALKENLPQLVEMMSFDFEVNITVFVGQVWREDLVKSFPLLFKAEHTLFLFYCQIAQRKAYLDFPKLFLWAKNRNVEEIKILENYLAEMIYDEEYLSETIMTLWSESLVLSKVAQDLFIHRNTLNYRLDKFYDKTGLQLRHIEDLSLCYFVLLSQ